jgi:hypothetical protein
MLLAGTSSQEPMEGVILALGTIPYFSRDRRPAINRPGARHILLTSELSPASKPSR